jgi:ubiquinone/menaquinone biosynthesis C-methylase UbiE
MTCRFMDQPAAMVARLPLAASDGVLDLCCGAGASAIPAARAAGPAGKSGIWKWRGGL